MVHFVLSGLILLPLVQHLRFLFQVVTPLDKLLEFFLSTFTGDLFFKLCEKVFIVSANGLEFTQVVQNKL